MKSVTIERDQIVYAAVLGAAAIAADTPYVLVDLSDTTGFPHDKTGAIRLLKLILDAEGKTSGQYDIFVGVITENDATDGSATWLYKALLEVDDNPTDSTWKFHDEVDFTCGGANPAGVNLRIVSGALQGFVSNLSQASSTNWQNDTNRTSPAGATTNPGVGDLVALIDETGGTGTIDFVLTALYDTIN